MACLHTNGSDVRRTATAVRHAREAAHWGRLALAIKSMLVVLLVVGLAGGVEAQEDLWTQSIEQAGAVVMAETFAAQSVNLWPLSAVLRGSQNAPCWGRRTSSDGRTGQPGRPDRVVLCQIGCISRNGRFSQETTTWISRNRIGSTMDPPSDDWSGRRVVRRREVRVLRLEEGVWGMSRALLKLSSGSVHDYATISDDSPSPRRASRARRAATSAGIS